MIPEIFNVCIEMARKYNIHRIRLVNETKVDILGENIDPIKYLGSYLMSIWSKKNISLAKNSRINYNESFFGFRHSGNMSVAKEYLINSLNNSGKNIEINFHPAIITPGFLDEYPWYKNADFDYSFLLNENKNNFY